jgi:hypothetical protein
MADFGRIARVLSPFANRQAAEIDSIEFSKAQKRLDWRKKDMILFCQKRLHKLALLTKGGRAFIILLSFSEHPFRIGA